MKTKWIARLLLFGMVLTAAPVFAHHGRAAYDMTKLTTVKGLVTEFSWANPHSIISMDVKNDKGVVEHWVVEAEPPTTLSRCGWTTNGSRSGLLVNVGDQITAMGNRVKTGQNIMYLAKIVMANGKELTDVCKR